MLVGRSLLVPLHGMWWFEWVGWGETCVFVRVQNDILVIAGSLQ